VGLPPFSFAYQPIVDVENRSVFAYEALVRGPGAEPASSVFAGVDATELYQFDHAARMAAVTLASSLGLKNKISLNLMPGSLESIPNCLEILIGHARDNGIGEQLLLEVTEGEVIRRPREFAQQLIGYRAAGVQLGIDDFGAGYSGLNLLADFQPDFIKLDMHLVRDIDHAGPRQAIVRGILQVCDDLGIEVLAEGVETIAEFRWFRRIGVRLFQGYLFGKPTFQALAAPEFP
jgi:blue light- and temperature-responsive anti-repressor